MDEQPTNVPNSSSGEPFQPLQPASNLSGPNWPDIGMRQEEEKMSVDQNQEQEEEHKKEDQAPQEQPDQQIETENLDQEEPLHENKLEETEANLSERIHEQLEPQSQEVMEPPYPQQDFQQENFQDFQTHATDLHEEEGHQQNVHSVPESNLQNETQNQLSNLQQMEEQQQQFVPQQPQTMSSPSQFQQGQQPHHQTTFSTQQPQTIPPPSQFQQGQQQHQSTLSPQQPQTIPLPSQFQQGQQHESTLSHNLSEQQSLPQAIEQQHQNTISHNLSEQQSLPQVLEQHQQQENVHQQGLSSLQAQQQSSQKKVYPQSQQQQQISQTMQVHQTPTTQPQLHHHMAQHQQHIGLQQQQQHQLQQQQQMQQVQQQHQHQQIQQQQPHLGPQQQQHMQQQKQLQQQIFHQQPGSHPLQMQHQAQPQSQQQIQHQNPQPKHQQIQYPKIPHPQAQHPQIPHPQAQQQHQLSQVHMPRQQMQMQRQPQLSPLASQTSMGQLSNAAARRPNHHANSISFGSLIPIIMPKISKEQAQQLQGLYQKLRNNEVTKEDFLRMTRTIVGDQMLVTAVRQMQMKVQQQHAESQTAQGSQQRLQQQQSHFQPQLPQQNLPSLPSNESTAFPQIPPLNIHSQTQQPADYQFQSPSTAPHSSADGICQHSMQSGEQRSDPSNLNMNQNSSINLHQVKHEVDRTMASRQLPNQHQQMSTAQPPFAMYARAHSSYSGHAFPVSAGISQPNALKPPIFDSQIRGTMHPQGPMQSQGIAAPVANPKVMSKFESQKLPRRLEDDDRLKTLQAGAHLSTQHHQGVWGTAIEREQTLSTTMSASTQAIVKQEANDESFDQQNKMRTLQAGTDNSFAVKGSLDQGQSFSQQKPESAEQLMKTSGTLTMNQTFNSAGTHTEHAMQGQHRAQLPSTAPSVPAGSQIKTPTKKSVLGHKKPNDNIGSSQTPSKKQKVSGSFPDQSIDQLNDVTAVSGVNLREEEEQLFAGSKEESHTTEAMRRVVQEEEERMFLEKGPLHDKIVEIMAKCGIKNIGSDTERCLSLGVEERMRTMISGLIKLSRQREDKERGKHKVVITSDVRSQIQQINKKAKDEWEKKQAEEAEKLRKVTEVENNVEIEKEETRSKAQKPNKEEEDKMRANAANVAARAAIGGDDLLTKWQFLAEQARQKREGASDGTASNVRGNKEMKKKPTSVLKSAGGSEQQEVDKRNDKMIGPAGNAGRNPGPSSQIKFTGTITLNDLIAYLESEPQMTKSNVLYRLYVMGALQNKDT